jgi:uncharacterized membrane-anchored protein YhcB (DUF1043 family)
MQTDQAAAEAAARAEAELQEIKVVALDSADLATRAASLATNAGTDMRQATEMMVKAQDKQRKQAMILLLSSGGLMLLCACIFLGVSITLSSRLKMADAMLLAVGKRVTELDGTMETVASVNEALQTMAEHQENNKKSQEKLEARLDEVVKSTQALPEAAAKQLEDKSQAIVKQVQSMDGRLAAQASALKNISSQVQTLQGQINESGQRLRTEVESMSRQQRERQNAEAAAAKAAAQKQKDRDNAVQYPRPPTPGASAAKP